MNKKYYTFISRPKNEKLLINKCMSNWQFKSLPLNNFCLVGERGNTNTELLKTSDKTLYFRIC